jgi:hypothetical protein
MPGIVPLRLNLHPNSLKCSLQITFNILLNLLTQFVGRGASQNWTHHDIPLPNKTLDGFVVSQ